MRQAAIASGRENLAKILLDIPDYHTTPVQAAEIARASGAGHLLLYHPGVRKLKELVDEGELTVHLRPKIKIECVVEDSAGGGVTGVLRGWVGERAGWLGGEPGRTRGALVGVVWSLWGVNRR